MSPLLPAQEYLQRLDDCRERFVSLLGSVPETTPVPTCPGWTVRDLASHLGGVHAWAAAIVRGAGPDADRPAAPADTHLADWYRQHAVELADVLRGAPPAGPAWSFGAERTVRFWFRRQAHETAMHRVDLQHAARQPAAYDDVLAADAVQEVFDVMMPHVNRSAIAPIVAPLIMSCEDADDRWLLRPSREVGTVDHDHTRAPGGSGAAARIRATASDLALGLWKRPTATPWFIEGDRSVVETLLAGTLTP